MVVHYVCYLPKQPKRIVLVFLIDIRPSNIIMTQNQLNPVIFHIFQTNNYKYGGYESVADISKAWTFVQSLQQSWTQMFEETPCIKTAMLHKDIPLHQSALPPCWVALSFA